MAIKLDDLQTILIQSGLAAEKRFEVIKNARDFEDAEKEEKEASPKCKYKMTVIIRGDKSLEDTVQQAWIVKSKEDLDDNEIPSRLKIAAVRHNENVKKRRHIVELWRDAFAFIKRKTTKEADIDIDIKTREPVRVIVIDEERIINETTTN